MAETGAVSCRVRFLAISNSLGARNSFRRGCSADSLGFRNADFSVGRTRRLENRRYEVKPVPGFNLPPVLGCLSSFLSPVGLTCRSARTRGSAFLPGARSILCDLLHLCGESVARSNVNAASTKRTLPSELGLLAALFPSWLALAWLVSKAKWFWTHNPELQFGWVMLLLCGYLLWEAWEIRPQPLWSLDVSVNSKAETPTFLSASPVGRNTGAILCAAIDCAF